MQFSGGAYPGTLNLITYTLQIENNERKFRQNNPTGIWERR
jgi:hypothetical protein